MMRRRTQRVSHSLKPNPKIDFNLSGVNIPISQNDQVPDIDPSPSLTKKPMRFPPPRAPKATHHPKNLLVKNSRHPKSSTNNDLSLNFQPTAKSSLPKSHLNPKQKNSLKSRTKLRIARGAKALSGRDTQNMEVEAVNYASMANTATHSMNTPSGSDKTMEQQIENLFPEIR